MNVRRCARSPGLPGSAGGSSRCLCVHREYLGFLLSFTLVSWCADLDAGELLWPGWREAQEKAAR